MPTPKKYASNVERQAAYRARCKLRGGTSRVQVAPGYRRWVAMIEDACRLLEGVTYEMECYREERSERWQESDRGERFVETIESLQEVVSLIGDLPL